LLIDRALLSFSGGPDPSLSVALEADPQILEQKGLAAGFMLGSSIKTYKTTRMIEPHVYSSVDDSVQLLTDSEEHIREIVAYGPGMFTQRLATIRNSSMEEVLRRYGKGSIANLKGFVIVSYEGIAFGFVVSVGNGTDPLQSQISFIILQRGTFDASRQGALDELHLPALIIKSASMAIPIESFSLLHNKSHLLEEEPFASKVCISIGHIYVPTEGDFDYGQRQFRSFNRYFYRPENTMNTCPSHNTIRKERKKPGNQMWLIEHTGTYTIDRFYIKVKDINYPRRTVDLEVGEWPVGD
jgi:hypothetical protein